MKIKIELDKDHLIQIILREVRDQTGNGKIQAKEIKIETRSTQNYRSTWESADFRAVVEHETEEVRHGIKRD